MKTPEQIAAQIHKSHALVGLEPRGHRRYREALVAAIEADRAQRSKSAPTLVDEAREITVGLWRAHPDMAADGGPEAIVVQIDTGDRTGRLRVNLNDAPVWDGNPLTDPAPGAWITTDPARKR